VTRSRAHGGSALPSIDALDALERRVQPRAVLPSRAHRHRTCPKLHTIVAIIEHVQMGISAQ
jgi:hypothetical protein